MAGEEAASRRVDETVSDQSDLTEAQAELVPMMITSGVILEPVLMGVLSEWMAEGYWFREG